MESAVLHRRMPSSPRSRSPPYSIEDMTFSEPRTVLFAGMSTPFLAPSWLGTATKVLACSTLSYTVGDKDSIETKLSWRWCRDNFLLPSDELVLVRCRAKSSGWIPMDTVKTLSDLSLAKDWLPGEIAHTVSRMEHKLIVIETTHDEGDALAKFAELECHKDAILVMGSRGRHMQDPARVCEQQRPSLLPARFVTSTATSRSHLRYHRPSLPRNDRDRQAA